MDEVVLAIQQLYPQVFHACHVAHSRRRTNAFRLSERDGAVLAHLGPDGSVTANELARHLGVGAPTLSAALQRLERLGYLARSPRSRSSPARPLHLTEQGRRALQATSVLDTERLAALLATLSARDRQRAVQGLEALVRGARNVAAAASGAANGGRKSTRNGTGAAS